MSFAFCFIAPSSSNASLCKPNPHRPFLSSSSPSPTSLHLRLSLSPTSLSLHHNNNNNNPHRHLLTAFSTVNDAVSFPGGDDDNNNNNGNSGGGGGGRGGDEGSSAEDKNREEALMVLAEAGRSLKNLPKDLAAAIEAGRVPGAVVSRFLELEKSPLLLWLMQFGGFKERLLADDLFLAKVFMERGVGMFTKTVAEYERRRENFFNELEIVFADVVMASLADFMLGFRPAPTVSLRPPLATSAGTIAKFFHNCPDNAFQVALAGTSYLFLQRLGAVVRNGTKLFEVGTASSLRNGTKLFEVGTASSLVGRRCISFQWRDDEICECSKVLILEQKQRILTLEAGIAGYRKREERLVICLGLSLVISGMMLLLVGQIDGGEMGH